jgi:hypothetical protein
MQRWQLAGAVLIGLVLGCCIPSRDPTPKAEAQTPDTATWEHLVTYVDMSPLNNERFSDARKQLGEAGKKGWELVAVAPESPDPRCWTHVCYLKRKVK